LKALELNVRQYRNAIDGSFGVTWLFCDEKWALFPLVRLLGMASKNVTPSYCIWKCFLSLFVSINYAEFGE